MKKKQIITEDFVITSTIAHAIHLWIHRMGDKINKFNLGIDRECAIREVIEEGLKEGRKKVEKFKDNLNGRTPKWTAKVMFDAGYNQQCLTLETFPAEDKKEAEKIAKEKVAAIFSEKPNVEVFEIKVKKAV
jgi:DNA-directed RNA polymerase subunit L